MSSFALKQLIAELELPGPFLFRRDYGQRAFQRLEQELVKVPLGRALTLDFADVAVMDTSFGDEAVIELAIGLSEDQYEDRFLVLESPNPATIDNLEGAVARRSEKVALLINEGECVRIIGHIESNLQDAWELVRQEGKMTARQLADRLRLQITTASMRLHKLYKSRVLARYEEVTSAGRQHIYALPR